MTSSPVVVFTKPTRPKRSSSASARTVVALATTSDRLAGQDGVLGPKRDARKVTLERPQRCEEPGKEQVITDPDVLGPPCRPEVADELAGGKEVRVLVERAVVHGPDR